MTDKWQGFRLPDCRMQRRASWGHSAALIGWLHVQLGVPTVDTHVLDIDVDIDRVEDQASTLNGGSSGMPMTDWTVPLSGGWTRPRAPRPTPSCYSTDGSTYTLMVTLAGVQTDTYTDSPLAFSHDLLLPDPDDQDGVDQPAGRGIPRHPRFTVPRLSAEELSGRLVVAASGLLTGQGGSQLATGAVSAEVITYPGDDDQLAAYRDLVASAHERTSLEVRSGTATT